MFYFEFGESAAGEQVGVYGCNDWVFDCDDLYDGAFFFFEVASICAKLMCGCYWYQVAAFLLAFKGIENLAKSDGPLSFSDIFTNPIFRNIVLSLLATLGLYIIASIIFVSLFIPKSLPMD